MKIWTNFAKTGNSNIKGLVDWPAYKEDTDQYLYITESLEVKSGFAEITQKWPTRTNLGLSVNKTIDCWIIFYYLDTFEEVGENSSVMILSAGVDFSRRVNLLQERVPNPGGVPKYIVQYTIQVFRS